MKIVPGNIWSSPIDHVIVIPTNVGWRVKTDENIMGTGLAKDAAFLYPDLPLFYGKLCKQFGDTIGLRLYDPKIKARHRLILAPVKRLNAIAPHLSWRNKADLKLIERDLIDLSELPFDMSIVLPFLGCGAGGLKVDQVLPIMEKYLDDRFTVTDRNEEQHG